MKPLKLVWIIVLSACFGVLLLAAMLELWQHSIEGFIGFAAWGALCLGLALAIGNPGGSN